MATITGASAQCDDQTPPTVNFEAEGPAQCGETLVTLTFFIEDDDDDDDDDELIYTIYYSIGGNSFSIPNASDGVMVSHSISGPTTAVFNRIEYLDDDDDFCVFFINQSIGIDFPAFPNLQVDLQQPTCGASNGSVTLSASGGQAPYSYALDGGNFQSGATFGGLSAGDYEGRVRDANGCEATVVFTLNSEDGPTASLSASQVPTCGASNGSATLSASGGQAPYSYALDGGNFQSGATFGGLSAGDYEGRVRDANGCEATVAFTLNSEDGPTASLSASQAPTCGESNGSATLSASGGQAPYSYALDGGNFQSSAMFGGLSAGDYDGLVRDANGCEAGIAFRLIDATDGLEGASINGLGQLLEACPGEVYTLEGNVPSGTTGQWAVEGEGIEILSQSSGNVQFIAQSHGQNLMIWQLSIPGCVNYSSDTLLVSTSPSPAVNDDESTVDLALSNSATIPILNNDSAGANGDYEVVIITPPSNGSANVMGSMEIYYEYSADNVQTDTLWYALCLLACPAICDTGMVVIQIVDEEQEDDCDLEDIADGVVFPEGITPNGDGLNDALFFRIVDEIGCPTNYANSDISIFNRWGDRVFLQEPYSNRWNGQTQSGEELPNGVYYYALRIRRENQEDFVHFGHVSIFR